LLVSLPRHQTFSLLFSFGIANKQIESTKMAQQRAQRPSQIHKPDDNDEFSALVDQQGI
jgi:hypothetical protein